MTERDIENIIREELLNLQDDIIDAHKKAGQYTTGKTASTLAVDAKGYTGQLVGASYISVLERGRQGGNVPKGFYHIIKAWAQNKGLSFDTPADLSRFAYFVSQKIADEGTSLYRDGGRTDILTEPIERFEKRLEKRLAGLYEAEITNQIFTKQ